MQRLDPSEVLALAVLGAFPVAFLVLVFAFAFRSCFGN